MGVKPAARSLALSSMSSSSVVGVASMPASLNWSLLYQKPSMPKVKGDAVRLAVDLPRVHRRADAGDRVGDRVVERLEVAVGDLVAQLAARPHLEEVGGRRPKRVRSG